MDITSIVEVLISLECINEYADRLSSYFFRNMIKCIEFFRWEKCEEEYI